jgi:hypothetical protein
MLSLYRAGRQPESLDTYRVARRALIDELGIDPTPTLQALHGAILRQEPSLIAPSATPQRSEAAAERSILAVCLDESGLVDVAGAASLLARGHPPASVVLARVLGLAGDTTTEADLVAAARVVDAKGAVLRADGIDARSACFRSFRPADDIARLATSLDADLLLVDAPATLGDDGHDHLPDMLTAVLGESVCDAAIAFGFGGPSPEHGGDVVVPFGGSEHDWAALELAGRLAAAGSAQLRLVGLTKPDEGIDASFLLAAASLAVQRVSGVSAEPHLVTRDPQAIVAAAEGAWLVVTGLSSSGRGGALGVRRLALIRAAPAPLLLVRRGVRPGLLAPRDAATRFTWTVAPPG